MPIYSSEDDEQAAYARYCELVFQAGDLLRTLPRGSYLDCAQGSYFVSAVEGEVKVYEIPGSKPTPADDQVWYGIHCDGIGVSDLNEICATMTAALANPQIETVTNPAMLDALVLLAFPIA